MSEKELEKPATERALELRQRHKSKKPKFRRQESWRYKRVSEVWRKPDGIDSKMKRKLRGWPKSVEIGYRGPRVARRLHPSGYIEVLVRTFDDLGEIDPETQAIRIAHEVGMKKRAEIALRAGERGIHILNPLPEAKPEEEEGAEETETETKTEAADAEEGEEDKKKS
jgi:large subunit ribosomal protein L32e